MAILAGLHDVLFYSQFLVPSFQIRDQCVMPLFRLPFVAPFAERTPFAAEIPNRNHAPRPKSLLMLHTIAAMNSTTAQVLKSQVFITVHHPARYAAAMKADRRISETTPGNLIVYLCDTS
jgi:hypothetical protein